MVQRLCVISAEQESWVVEHYLKTLYRFQLINVQGEIQYHEKNVYKEFSNFLFKTSEHLSEVKRVNPPYKPNSEGNHLA